MTIQFGSFEGICQTAALVICPLVQSDQGVEPTCYSRNVDLGGTLIFQPCTSLFFSLKVAAADTGILLVSHMLHPYCSHHYDWHNDLSYSQ